MKQIPVTMRSWIIQATAFAWLAVIMSVGTAQANGHSVGPELITYLEAAASPQWPYQYQQRFGYLDQALLA